MVEENIRYQIYKNKNFYCVNECIVIFTYCCELEHILDKAFAFVVLYKNTFQLHFPLYNNASIHMT